MHVRTPTFPSDNLMETEIDPKKTGVRSKCQLLNKTRSRQKPSSDRCNHLCVGEGANLSLDFLVGFTVFIIAFIYVATLIPGLLLDIQNRNIDYSGVAYRTGVILTEDPGSPSSWESQALYSDYFINTNNIRLGLAVSKDTPNVLSTQKINRFYCSTTFNSPQEYLSRVIFGDYPYMFNISLQITGENATRSVGEIIPDKYGYIRRVVKVKGYSNVTIGEPLIGNLKMNSTDNVTTHTFTVLFNSTDLLANTSNPASNSPLYQINPWQDQLMVNLTDLEKTMGNSSYTNASLVNLTILRAQQSQPYPNPSISIVEIFDSTHPPGGVPPLFLYADGNSTPVATLPVNVSSNLSLVLSPGFFYNMGYNTNNQLDQQTQLYVKYTFQLSQNDTYLNNTVHGPFPYTYSNVTPSTFRDGVMEIAVW